MLPGITPIVAGLVWRPAFDGPLTTDSGSSYANRLARVQITSSRLLVSGKILRVRFSPRNAGANTVFSGVFIGHRAASGATSDIDPATLQQLTFDGVNTVTIAGGGGPRWSDAIPFQINPSRDLIVSMGFSTAAQTARVSTTSTGCTLYLKDSSAASAGTAIVAGWSATQVGNAACVDMIEAA